MGLLSRIFGRTKKETQSKADVGTKPEISRKEVKPVADKITVGHVHMSGCTGCLVSLADNYVRHIPKMDVALVEGSVCINDKTSVEEIKQTREKAKVVVAVGGCACYGNITRFARGGQQNQPKHENYLPIGDLINVDVYIPGCAPTPQLIRNVCVMAYLLLKGTKEQQELAGAYLKPLMNLAKRGTTACFCDLIYDVIDQGLCIGCGTCAAACPVRAITHEYGRPQGQRDLCIKCGACYSQCPRSFLNMDVIKNFESIQELIKGVLA
jgi:coenzyme F420 hydrogenase subunit gamma